MATFRERAAHSINRMFVLCLFAILVVSKFGFAPEGETGSDCTSSWSVFTFCCLCRIWKTSSLFWRISKAC